MRAISYKGYILQEKENGNIVILDGNANYVAEVESMTEAYIVIDSWTWASPAEITSHSQQGMNQLVRVGTRERKRQCNVSTHSQEWV